MVDNIATGAYEIRFSKLFYPENVGQYSFRTTYNLHGVATSYTTTVNILPGFTSANVSTIGPGGTFGTFRAAIDALFRRGVQGHTVFEFINTNINCFDVRTHQPNGFIDTFTTADFRGRIAGLDDPNSSVTFRPSPSIMTGQDPVVLQIRNPSGIGLMFGSALSTNIHSAAVN
jgi:hypothetical protein